MSESVAAVAPAADLPDGYVAVARGTAHGVVLAPLARVVRDVLREGTLYEYAARHPRARAMSGRAIAYAVPLPDAVTHVVVRHNRHGGLLRRITGDRFLPPTRAPHELRVSRTLAARGVPTPEIVAYCVYPAGPLLRRADVASREIQRGCDLAFALLAPPDRIDRQAVLEATAVLLVRLAEAGAHHADLNLKNVLLAPTGDGAYVAHVLDVDRVRFFAPRDPRVATLNHARLARSAQKWRRLYGANVDTEDLDWLARRVAREAR